MGWMFERVIYKNIVILRFVIIKFCLNGIIK